jgi:hypothetical protein
MKLNTLLFLLVFIASLSCKQKENTSPAKNSSTPTNVTPKLSREVYYNKVLGLLIGSAIGDAMGAPTEGWGRRDIQISYGFVTKLDSMVRNAGAEGPWKFNLPAGGTTDDTRWKNLFANYAFTEHWPSLKPENFATYIVDEYLENIKTLKATDSFHPEPYEDNLMKMNWLQEWALVADPYQKNQLKEYSNAVSKFYGGEMTCAGMLYSPMIGACVPGNPEAAYLAAYDLSIFDIGYAKDITSLVAAMTSQAFIENGSKESLASVIRNVDPKNYFKSRLVGRLPFGFYSNAANIAAETRALTREDIPASFKIPVEVKGLDLLEYFKITETYRKLDKYNQDIMFHAGEIYLIAVTAMMCSDYDFEKTLQFVINYGRDNDTVAAVVGAILGVYYGADQLPEKQKQQILKVNKEMLNIDLEALAMSLTNKYLE